MVQICKFIGLPIITLFALTFCFTGCNNVGGIDCPRCQKPQARSIESPHKIEKPVVNVYMENSGSMFGYVNGLTEFEESVYSYLSDIRLNCTDSMSLFYINSKIIPQQQNLNQTSRIKDFIKRLSPSHFIQAGGSLGVTDISDMMAAILDKTDDNTVSVFISDCIFSPGRGVDADAYLVNQQIGVKVAFADKLKIDKEFCVKAYRLNGKFKGKYYNRLDQPTLIDDIRPFYILLMGRESLVNNITDKVTKDKIKGRGVECSFAISNLPHQIKYEIVNAPKIGTFRRCMKNPKHHLVNASKADKGKNQGNFMFSVGADFSNIPVDDDYLSDANNYTLSYKDYELSLTNSKDEKYTHRLCFTLKPQVIRPGKCNLNIVLKKQLPLWVNQYTDNEGLNINQKGAMQQTYGLKYLFEGIYEAFTNNEKMNFAEMKILIN